MPCPPYKLPGDGQPMLRRHVRRFFQLMLVMMLLQFIPVQQVNGQVRRVIAEDSTQKYKKKLEGLISDNATSLCNKIAADRNLFEKIIGACINAGKRDGYELMLNNYFAELTNSVNQEIALKYSNRTNGVFFGKRKIQVVERDAEEIIKSLRKGMPVDPESPRMRRSRISVKNPIFNCLWNRCNTDSVPNRPPKANAGRDQTITGTTVMLDGSGSSDPDNDQLVYIWQKVEGPGPAFSTNPSFNAGTSAGGLLPGVYGFELTVIDARKATDRDRVIIEVKKPVILPTADAGGPYAIDLGQTNRIRLIGEAGGPPREELKVTWLVVGDPAGIEISSPNSEETEVSIQGAGTYTFQFVVTSGDNKAADNAVVTVTARPEPEQPVYTPPIVKAGEDATVYLPDNEWQLNGSVKGNQQYIINWSYFPNKPGITIEERRNPVTMVSGLTEGVYHFILTAGDRRYGFVSDTVIITIKEKPVIDPPVKKDPRANAGDDRDVYPGKHHLDGSGVDEDGQIVKYKWELVNGARSGVPADAFSPNAAIQLKDTGKYEYKLTVTDNDGNTGEDTVLIQVVPGEKPDWIWIVAGVVLLGGSISGWYFLIWLRIRRKLILYFMNPGDEALAEKLMSSYDKADGCLVGHATRGNIRMMEKEGLAFRLLTPGVLTINTPGDVRIYRFSLKKGKYVLQKITRKNKGHRFVNILAGTELSYRETMLPAYYIVTLDSPLLPQYGDQLERAGLPVLHKVPQYSYVVQVKDQQQLDRLQDRDAFPFIRMVQQYTAADTGFTVNKEQYNKAGADENDGMIMLDVVLHSREDLERVAAMLIKLGAEPTGTFNRTIRTRIAQRKINPAAMAADPHIQAIYQHLPPVLHNDETRRIVGIDGISANAVVFPETGKGEVVAVADTGIDEGHPDFAKRIAGKAAWGRENDTSDPDGHGTHVAGTIAGDGKESGGKIKGMSPGAKLYVQSLLTKEGEIADLAMGTVYELLQEAYNNEARIINLSWGALQESYYTVESEMIDQFMYENPEVLVVVAAGNEGLNAVAGKEADTAAAGYVGSFASNKNGLTVGASVSSRESGDTESIAGFSNRGPCDDYRIKPDIVAPGSYVLSARSTGVPDSKYKAPDKNPSYAFKGGTSMAAPVVSGAAALVREYFRKRKNNKEPSAVLIKATLLNGTRQLGGKGAMQGTKMIPNNHQGYGMLDMQTTIPGSNENFALWYADSMEEPELVFTKRDEERFWLLTLQTDSWIRVCMVYRDRAVRSTQADLTLLMGLEGTKTKWWGNAGIKSNGEFPDKEEYDRDNNTEIIRVVKAKAGIYKIAVKAANIRMDEVAFALVVTTGDKGSGFEQVGK